ncbi:MAG: hypothetical protein V1907_05050 [Candidatus Kerfeldbacteria bacterium]
MSLVDFYLKKLATVALQPVGMTWAELLGLLRGIQEDGHRVVEFTFERPEEACFTSQAELEQSILMALRQIETASWFQIDAISQSTDSRVVRFRAQFGRGEPLGPYDKVRCRCGRLNDRSNTYCIRCGLGLIRW